MPAPLILALDQSSSQTGFALGRPDGPVALGSYENPSSDKGYGQSLTYYETWLETVVPGVGMIGFEKPVLPARLKNLHVARLLYGIAGVIELVAVRHKIPVVEIDTGKMKMLIYGKGGAKPEFWLARKHSRAWGFEPKNGDESDAAGVFLSVVQHQFPEHFGEWLARRAAA
jgi:hypothetical protein